MSGVSSWLLGIAGVVILSVLAELVLPDGQINKYIKVIFSFMILLVIIAPLPGLFGKEYDFNKFFGGESTELQEDFVYQNNLDKLTALTEDITSKIESAGLKNVEISINANILSEVFEVKSIYVDLSKMQYDANFENKTIDNAKQTIEKIIHNFSILEDVEVTFSQ